MKSETLKKQARALNAEYKLSHLMFYSLRRKAGYIRRLKNLAGKISLSAAADKDTNLSVAAMLLDQVGLWMDLDLTPHFQE